MAITQQGISATITATNDSVTFGGVKTITGITFQGTGLTAGQRITLRNKTTVGAGSILADYVTMAATDNADLWGPRERQLVYALSIDNTTVGGAWVITVFFGDGVEPA